MKIAQISDLHIAAHGQTLGVAPMAENLGKVVAHINGLSPDMVLVSGDITHEGTAAEATRAADILARLDAPYYLTAGNHDRREVLRRVFTGPELPATENTHLSYVVDTPRLRIISLDSTDPDAHNGRICPPRAAWLEAQLAVSALPVLIFMHHPPVKFSVAETDQPPLEGANLLADVVARHPQIERILCGHIHLMAQTLWQGVLVCTAPSMGMRLSWHPATPIDSGFFVSPPAYLWHTHNADGNFISHEFTLDTVSGPHNFS